MPPMNGNRMAPTATATAFRSGTRILVIDADPGILAGAEIILGLHGADVVAVSNAEAAIDTVLDADFIPEAVVSGNRLPKGVCGIQAILGVRGVTRTDLPALLLSGDMEPGLATEAAARAIVFLPKPTAAEDLLGVLIRLTANRKTD